jgi:hypothetical protein
MNARQHLETAEAILARYGSHRTPSTGPSLDQSPGLVRALVHAVLAGALRGDGTLDQPAAATPGRERAYLGTCAHCGHALYRSGDGRPMDEAGEYLCSARPGVHQLTPSDRPQDTPET